MAEVTKATRGRWADQGAAVHNSVTFSDLATQVSEIGADNANILLAPGDTKTLTSDTTIPANVGLKGYMGVIDIAGFNLTVNGPVEGRTQMFEDSVGGGTVDFARGVCEDVLAEWFGAVGDGVADDTDAINAALRIAHTNGAERLLLLAKTYRVTGNGLDSTYFDAPSDDLESGYYGPTIEGVDRYRTVILGETTGLPVLDTSGTRRGTLRNLTIEGDGTNVPSCGLLNARNNYGAPTVNASCGFWTIKDVNIQGNYSLASMIGVGSEVNTVDGVRLRNEEPGAYTLSWTNANELGVSSAFGTLGSVESGNSTNWFRACSIQARGGGAGGAVLLQNALNTHFIGCTTLSQNASVVEWRGTNTVVWDTVRDESSAASYGFLFKSGSLNRIFTRGGTLQSGMYGEDTSIVKESVIAFDLLNSFDDSGTDRTIDLYDLVESEVYETSHVVRIRNDATNTELKRQKAASDVDVSGVSDANLAGFTWVEPGGSTMTRHRDDSTENRASEFWQIASMLQITNQSVTESAGGTVTPDLASGSSFRLVMESDATIGTPQFNGGTLTGDANLGMVLAITIAQDATGGWTPTFGAIFETKGWAPDTGANDVSTALFVFQKRASGSYRWVKV